MQSERSTEQKAAKSIFVIMPFVETLTRNKAELDSFFVDQIKLPIESSDDFLFEYTVSRSSTDLNITDKIIHSLYESDIVLCDLSGRRANPNVMYELGCRFSLTDKPVILIRENHVENEKIFDIQGFYAHPYNPQLYPDLIKHLKEKIIEIENLSAPWSSPVLNILGSKHVSLAGKARLESAKLISALMHSFQFATSAMVNSIILVCLKNDVDIDISDFKTVIDSLFDRKDVHEIDWASEFTGMPMLHPAMEKLLSEKYLDGLVPSALEHKFMACLNDFCLRNHGSPGIWKYGSSLSNLTFYLLCTTQLTMVSHLMAEFLQASPSSEQAKVVESKLNESIQRYLDASKKQNEEMRAKAVKQ